MDERNSTHDKNRLNDKCEVPQRNLQNSHRPQSAYTTYLTNEDRENPRVKHSAFRDIKDGNSQIRKQYGTDESLPRPQVGNSNFSFQGVRYDRNCDGQLQYPLINSASHCGVPFVQTLPYLATNAYMRNQTMLFESSAHAQKEIKPEVIHQTVDMTAYKLPPFMPVFSGMLNRRRRREHRPRRQRTTFSTEQTIKLEIEYGRAEYISRSRRYELAESLNLTENQIKIWFQNRRAKEKRIEKAHLDQNISLVLGTSVLVLQRSREPLPPPGKHVQQN